MASSLGDESDLPLGRLLHGFAVIEHRRVQVLPINTEVRPSPHCHRHYNKAAVQRVNPRPFTRRSVRLLV
jgi:hypothetical protein